jgi:hypothetical protein
MRPVHAPLILSLLAAAACAGAPPEPDSSFELLGRFPGAVEQVPGVASGLRVAFLDEERTAVVQALEAGGAREVLRAECEGRLPRFHHHGQLAVCFATDHQADLYRWSPSGSYVHAARVSWNGMPAGAGNRLVLVGDELVWAETQSIGDRVTSVLRARPLTGEFHLQDEGSRVLQQAGTSLSVVERRGEVPVFLETVALAEGRRRWRFVGVRPDSGVRVHAVLEVPDGVRFDWMRRWGAGWIFQWQPPEGALEVMTFPGDGTSALPERAAAPWEGRRDDFGLHPSGRLSWTAWTDSKLELLWSDLGSPEAPVNRRSLPSDVRDWVESGTHVYWIDSFQAEPELKRAAYDDEVVQWFTRTEGGPEPRPFLAARLLEAEGDTVLYTARAEPGDVRSPWFLARVRFEP